MLSNIILKVDGEKFSGWTEAKISRSIETLCGSFTLKMIDVSDEEIFSFSPNSLCSIYANNDLLITGYIDGQGPIISPNDASVTVSGRCKTSDLVDCSAINKPGSWRDIKVRQLITSLLNPNGNTFNIRLVVDTSLGEDVREFTLNSGESVYDAISRICEYRAFIPVSNGKGELVLTNVGSGKTNDNLVYAQNVPSAGGEFNFVNRFSEYIVKGQQSGRGKSWSKTNTQKVGIAKDEYITRFRPKVITAESEITSEGAQKRANWEAQIRAGRSSKINVQLPGWRQSNGDLWRENLRVFTFIPRLRVDGELLINEIEYNKTGESESVSMKLVDPIIYSKNPVKVIKKKTRKRSRKKVFDIKF